MNSKIISNNKILWSDQSVYMMQVQKLLCDNMSAHIFFSRFMSKFVGEGVKWWSGERGEYGGGEKEYMGGIKWLVAQVVGNILVIVKLNKLNNIVIYQ